MPRVAEAVALSRASSGATQMAAGTVKQKPSSGDLVPMRLLPGTTSSVVAITRLLLGSADAEVRRSRHAVAARANRPPAIAASIHKPPADAAGGAVRVYADASAVTRSVAPTGGRRDLGKGVVKGASRVLRSKPAGASSTPRIHKKPRHAGPYSCAREDSNLHGPFSPQGPQPCASTNSATGACGGGV